MTSRRGQHMMTRAPVRTPALLTAQLQEIEASRRWSWRVDMNIFLPVIAGTENVKEDHLIGLAWRKSHWGCKSMHTLRFQS